jgi:hypothetical protein
MHKKYIAVIAFVLSSLFAQSQELQSRLTIISSKVSTLVDKKVFLTMQFFK